MKHPKRDEHIAWLIANTINRLDPPAEDPTEEITTANELEITVETLREWRAYYQSWSTVGEWREQEANALTNEILLAIKTPGQRNWRRWNLSRWVSSQLYASGIACGGSYGSDWSGVHTGRIIFSGTKNKHNGKRRAPVYVLWWPLRKWRCVFVQRDWPTNDIIAFNLCSKCIPCHECGKPAPLDHECEVAA